MEAPNEVVGEDAELLPHRVGAVVSGRDDVEGELALELGDGFLLGATAADKGVEGWEVQGEIGGDGAVLEMAIVGVNRSSWKFLGLSWPTCLR